MGERPLFPVKAYKNGYVFLVNNDYYVFHSFTILEEARGILHENEIDFLVFNPKKGMLIIEAKAGKVQCGADHVWRYASGKEMSYDGPYSQADRNRWKLEKYIENKGYSEILSRLKTAHAVWFPVVNKTYLKQLNMPSDGDLAITLSAESLENPQADIDRIFDLPQASGKVNTLSERDSKILLDNVLCPYFEIIPSLTEELQQKEHVFHRLLREQTAILNYLDEQPSAVISGAAGTGKTLVAVEKARRHSDDGEKTLFLCVNRLLCEYLKKEKAINNVDYYTVDGFAGFWSGTTPPDYEKACSKLENSYFEGKFPYKHIVIDEGQDLGLDRIEDNRIIELLKNIVLSDEVDGSFYLFYDKNQLVQGKKIPDYISEAECRLTLSKNCRNTENIAVTSMRPLGPDKKPKLNKGTLKGDSPELYIVPYAEKQLEVLNKAISELQKKKIQDIVILTCKTEGQSIIGSKTVDGKYVYNNKSYRFTTCRKFKGLEADAVILVDVEKKEILEDQNFLFYVGASRAKFYLSIICDMTDEDCEECLEKMGVENRKNPRKAFASALNALLS